MAAPPCVQCGKPVPTGTRFCGECGAVQPAPAPPASSDLGATRLGSADLDARVSKKTVFGLSATDMAGPGAPAAAAPAPLGLNKATMIGVASPLAAIAPPPPEAPRPAPAPGARSAGAQTMIGGTAFAAPQPVAASQPAQSAPARNATMMGVAMPGIAPTGGPSPPGPPSAAAAAPRVEPGREPRPVGAMTMPLQVAYVPPPAPLRDVAPPPPPVVVTRKGFPVTAVAIGAATVLLVGGVLLAVLWKNAPPVTAKAHASDTGGDALLLSCEPASCPDGTTVTLGATRATFAGGHADLVLPAPLHLGGNEVAVVVDRPGMGRDETMKFDVPVAYRVRADVSTMSGPKPAVTVRVEASPGAAVQVDGKPVTLDAHGAGTFVVDEAAATLGPADESRAVSLDLKYTVTPKGGAPEEGTVSARFSVAPLRVDAPGPRTTVEDDHVVIAGRGPKGAAVTLDGSSVTVAPDGSFESSVPLTSLGDHVIETRAQTPSLLPRRVPITVTRVASLADAARDFEASGPIGYDAAMSDLAGKVGQPIVVEGPVLEARGVAHRALVLVDDARGCAHRPCLARVVVGRDLALVRGDVLHAYGTVARPFTTQAGQTVPEVESWFATRTKK